MLEITSPGPRGSQNLIGGENADLRTFHIFSLLLTNFPKFVLKFVQKGYTILFIGSRDDLNRRSIPFLDSTFGQALLTVL